MTQDAVDFNSFKTKWINEKCVEARSVLSSANATDEYFPLLQVTVSKLCSGPKFTEYQIAELDTYFNGMQNIFFGTKVCLPMHFDVCANLDHIWSFTYVRDSNGEVERLDLSNVVPEKYLNSAYNEKSKALTETFSQQTHGPTADGIEILPSSTY